MANPFTFIDLFAGIGGLRRAFETVGGNCIFTSEWNTHAQTTYRFNYKATHSIAGDITQIPAHDVPAHDVLLAGFPCQPFSLAGVSKKNSLGRQHGFACEAQGTLFFDVARIIKHHRPTAFLLENVKNLQSHDRGNTFRVIQKTLEAELGYHIQFRVIDAKGFVPQHRERIFIVGFREPTAFDFSDLALPCPQAKTMKDVLHTAEETPEAPYTFRNEEGKTVVNPKYTLSDKLWAYLQAYAEKHRQKGNGFGFGLVEPHHTARTLSARYHKDGSEILVSQGPGNNPRRLTPREAARLMGYGDDFVIPVSDTQAYRQFGNSVVVPVVEAIAHAMRPYIPSSLGTGVSHRAVKPSKPAAIYAQNN